MTFVWKTTCRRLQSSGGLTRFAEGHATERESREIETHLAACSSCQAIVAETLAVADLLKASVPAAPAKSLAASGNLWKTLEAEIAQTPQDRAFVLRSPEPEPVSAPRLQRFGRWLATPGAMPFGAVAAAAVVVMVGGTVAYQRGLFPAEKQMATIAAPDTAVGDSEFTILPSPSAPAPASVAAGAAAKVTGASRQPLARGGTAVALAPRTADSITADVLDNEIAPIKTKPSVLRSRSLPAPAPLPLSVTAPSPAALSVPTFRIAKASSNDSAATSASALSDPAGPAQVAEAARPTTAAGGFGGSPAGVDSVLSNNAAITVPSSGAMARSTAVPAPAPALAPIVRGSVASAAVSGSDENVSGELQDIPASRSLLDMALRQRRQRSLFSYATR